MGNECKLLRVRDHKKIPERVRKKKKRPFHFLRSHRKCHRGTPAGRHGALVTAVVEQWPSRCGSLCLSPPALTHHQLLTDLKGTPISATWGKSCSTTFLNFNYAKPQKTIFAITAVTKYVNEVILWLHAPWFRRRWNQLGIQLINGFLN